MMACSLTATPERVCRVTAGRLAALKNYFVCKNLKCFTSVKREKDVELGETLHKLLVVSVKHFNRLNHFIYLLYSKNPHKRTHLFTVQADFVLIHRKLSAKSA